MGVPLTRGKPGVAGSPLVAGVETVSDARTEAEVDFEAWVNDYQKPLLAFAQLVAGDRETGEDLLQVALARAYLKWPKISGPGPAPAGLRSTDRRERERLPMAAGLEAT